MLVPTCVSASLTDVVLGVWLWPVLGMSSVFYLLDRASPYGKRHEGKVSRRH